jgi:hypothetical protein
VFDTAEIAHEVDKATWKAEEPPLRQALLEAQFELQKQRLEELASKKSTRWRVGEHEWEFFKRYDELAEASEHFVRATSTGYAPWYVVNGRGDAARWSVDPANPFREFASARQLAA